ncbi:hypothetical protein SAMN06265171_106281 [Chryseobacterium rhizoplanae]|uniref:YD repeat-containing protein n=1 Tax=Chryseobacterium rhizoplanae TaxID=1609531 RepID=A0A521E0W1_9FLAO|nr:hypothetical protein [Chryseobacterium rhizoplanae]SMO77607.1 hypothetical protein SAMN06265171_106281 [Chryseobacterium rhizoplanae]
MKRNITSLFFCLSMSVALAQTTGSKQSTLPNIIPPSAESYKLGAFGNLPVSLFTGNANVDIPVTSFAAGNINIPIRLNYFSNGVKVDDMNGSTGLGWNIVSGGVITRVIRDLPDEDNQSNINIPTNIGDLGANTTAAMQFFQDASFDDIDTEQDLYMASFGGMQIKFVFDKKGISVIYSQKDVVIEGTSGGNSFIITVDNGIKYYFTDKETTSNRTAGAGHSLISISTTAWYLTKIEDISSGEVVFFENVDGGYTATMSQSQTLSYTSPNAGPMTSSCGNSAFIRYPQVSELISHNQTVAGKQIKRIYSNNPSYGEIIFDYLQSGGSGDYKRLQKVTKKVNGSIINDVTLNYNLTANNRLFLTSVVDSVLNTTYGFQYNLPDVFPQRLAFSRDSWGYYNGNTSNTNLVPNIEKVSMWSSYNGASQSVVPQNTAIGILQKIIYPTKGSTEFFYENHTAIEKNVMLSPSERTGTQIKATADDTNGHVENTVAFTPLRTEDITLGGSAQFNSSCDPAEQVTGKHRAIVSLLNSNGQAVPLYFKTPTGIVTSAGNSVTFPTNNGAGVFAHVQKDEPLTLKLWTLFVCTRSTASASYTTKEAVYGDREAPIGGLRIAKIVDTSENGVANTRKFIYRDLNDQYTEAVVLRTPAFEEQLLYTRTCSTNNPNLPSGSVPTGVERFPYTMVTSSNINQLFATHPNVFYKTVQEIVEGKSNIIHNYSISSDDFGKVLHGDNIRNSVWTNFGWKNGRELLTKYLDAEGNLLRSVEMNYEEDNNRKYQVDGFSIRKNYDNPVTKNETKLCTAEDVVKTISYTYCAANHSHRYNALDGYKNCQASGAQNTTQSYNDVCFGKPVGPITYEDKLDNLDIMQYKNISHFEYLKSQKTIDYLNGNAMKTETQYFYNNPKHTQITSEKIIFPDLSTTEKTYQYAHEKNNQLMIDKNMVGISLETKAQQTVDNITKVTSREETIYPTALPHAITGNLVLPLSEYSYDTLSPTTSSKDVTYEKYDDKGNILQYREKDGTPVSIVWGYNKTRPIAKVVGALYSQVEGMITTIVTKSNEDAADPTKEAELLLALDAFQPVGMTTKYTYDPLVGVTTITPPSGIRELYVYDSANRLKQVQIRERDSAGTYSYKVVKEFKYNYKQ